MQRENSRFRTLMAAQLNAAGDEQSSVIVVPDTGTQHGD